MTSSTNRPVTSPDPLLPGNAVPLARRCFLGRSAQGIGGLALATMLGEQLNATAAEPAVQVTKWPGALKTLHFPAKTKRVIFLCMAGGASHLETWDHKPKRAEMNGKPMPESYTKGQPIAQLQGKKLTCLAPQHEFKKYGKSGQSFSSIFPHLGTVADEMCIIRSMKTEAINHDPAHTFMNTGTTISGRPSMGAWLTYGLGAETDNLPGFVVLTSVGGGQNQPIASRQWHSGFLPSRFQGVHFHSKGDPVLYVKNPDGVTRGRQRDVITAIQKLNQLRNNLVEDREISTRISQYELAFRMQMSVPQVMDVTKEPKHIQESYGTTPGQASFANNCLLARRLVEQGGRYVQLFDWGWDMHGTAKSNDLVTAMPKKCREVDRPIAALLSDLKQRGLLDETLVIWSGEFGRTSLNEERNGSKFLGRDHHPHCFSMWMAGGGVRGGVTHGETDELGYFVARDKVGVHDLQATVLHLLGFDPHRLSFRYQGLNQRLIGPEGDGHVIQPVVA